MGDAEYGTAAPRAGPGRGAGGRQPPPSPPRGGPAGRPPPPPRAETGRRGGQGRRCRPRSSEARGAHGEEQDRTHRAAARAVWAQGTGGGEPRPDPGGRKDVAPPPPTSVGRGPARPGKGPRGTASPGGMFGQGATVVVDPGVPTGSPPPQVVRRRPFALLGAVTKQNASPHHRVPPVPRAPAAIPVPGGQARAAATLPRPPAGLGAADAPVGGAERPGTGHPPLAGPSEPLAAPSPPLLGGRPRDRRLRPLRPRGASPPASPSGGHPHGMLPQLDGHGRAA